MRQPSHTHPNRGLKRAKDEFNSNPKVQSGEEPHYDYGIIATAMRMFSAEFSPYYSK